MQGKNAVSHIEMVISFTMFALFVFFLLVYLNPVRNQNISDVLLDAIQNSLEENATLQIIELPFSLKTGVEFCFSLTNPFNTSDSRNIIAKDYNGNVVKFSLSGDNIRIEENGDFYYLYFANALFSILPLEAIQCTQLNATQYGYAASRTYEVLLMQRLQGIENRYTNDYNGLREDFNFPSGYDFAVNITNSETKQNILSMRAKKPEKVEVIAREVPVEILYEDGRIAKANMNIQVW